MSSRPLFGILAKTVSALLVLLPLTAAAQQQNLPPNTVVGRLNVSAGPAQAIPITQLLKNVVGPNSVTNASLAQMPAATFKCNASASLSDTQDCTIQGLSFSGTPDATNDRILVYSASTGTLYATSPGSIASAATAGVSSLGSVTGAVGLASGLKMTGSNLDLDLGNGLTTSGGSLAASLGAGLAFSGNNIAWTATTASYTNSGTGSVARTMQSRLDSGVIYSADFGTVCNGSTNDYSAMLNFLTALSTRGNVIGVINSATSGNTNCFMGNNPFRLPSGATVMCALNMTLTFTYNGALVSPAGGSSGRTFRGRMSGCGVDGTSRTTYSSSICLSTLNGTDYTFDHMQLRNCGIGIHVTNTDPVNYGSNYNRFEDIIIGSTGNYAINIDEGSNSNNFRGVRVTDAAYGVYCHGNQNSFGGMQIEGATATAFYGDASCVGSMISGVRFEGVVNAITFVSGANYNSVIGAYCDGVSGSSYTNLGSGNSKTGGSC